MAKKRLEEYEQKNMQNKLLRERLEQGAMNTRVQYMSKVKEEAEKTKQNIKEAKNIASQNRDETFVKNAVTVQKIRQSKMELDRKKRLQQVHDLYSSLGLTIVVFVGEDQGASEEGI